MALRKVLEGTDWGSSAIVCEGSERGRNRATRTGSNTATATSRHALALIFAYLVQRTRKPESAGLAVIMLQLFSLRILQVTARVPQRCSVLPSSSCHCAFV